MNHCRQYGMYKASWPWRVIARLTQDFGENENKNHSDEETGLLRGSSDTSITDNTNGETGSETGETDGQTGTELDEAREEGDILLEAVRDKHGHDQAVDTDDTSHNDGDNVYPPESADSILARERLLGMGVRHTLHDKIGSENTHGGDTNTGLGGTVGGAQAGEDDGGGAAHGAEEGLSSMLAEGPLLCVAVDAV